MLGIVLVIGCGFYLWSSFSLFDDINIVVIESVWVYVFLVCVFDKCLNVYGLFSVSVDKILCFN